MMLLKRLNLLSTDLDKAIEKNKQKILNFNLDSDFNFNNMNSKYNNLLFKIEEFNNISIPKNVDTKNKLYNLDFDYHNKNYFQNLQEEYMKLFKSSKIIIDKFNTCIINTFTFYKFRR